MVDLEGTLNDVNIYCLSTVGSVNMISEAGQGLALYSDNVNVFTDNIALFQLAAGSGQSGTHLLGIYLDCRAGLSISTFSFLGPR